MPIFSLSTLRSTQLILAAGLLALSACGPLNRGVQPRMPAATLPGIQSQNAPTLHSQFVSGTDIPSRVLSSTQQAAQQYSDLISERRDLDRFQLHGEAVGLRLNQNSYILSFLGTALTRNDLNVELRVLSGENQGMNLNYSGPVTRNLENQNAPMHTTPTHKATEMTQTGLHFELITGLPPEHITQAYGDHLEQLARYLRYRFQSQPIAFDDGPLIYALTENETLRGFAFFNQRNILTLGDRKYADVQSVAVIDTQAQLQGAYTLVAFNPKTEQAGTPLQYRFETPDSLGTLALLGEF